MISSLVVATWLFAQPTGEAEPAEVAARAAAKLVSQEYEEALHLWEEAIALDPQPNYLWGAAQAARMSGDCTLALDYYERFVAAVPEMPAETMKAVEVNVAYCREQLGDLEPDEPEVAEDPEPPVPPSPRVATPTDPSPPQPRPAPRDRPWHRSPAGGVLLGLGLGAGVAAGILGAVARSTRARANDQPTEDAYGDDFDRADRLRIGAITTAVAAGALTTAAIVVYAVVARKAR
jgi:tetratricopeptide (TPR) repeat protein